LASDAVVKSVIYCPNFIFRRCR